MLRIRVLSLTEILFENLLPSKGRNAAAASNSTIKGAAWRRPLGGGGDVQELVLRLPDL